MQVGEVRESCVSRKPEQLTRAHTLAIAHACALVAEVLVRGVLAVRVPKHDTVARVPVREVWPADAGCVSDPDDGTCRCGADGGAFRADEIDRVA